jgi:putative transposase
MRLRISSHTVYKTNIISSGLPVSEGRYFLGSQRLSEDKASRDQKVLSRLEYLEIGIDIDHIHLYMLIPPKYAVSKVVEIIKSNTSRALKEKFTFLQKVYWDDKGIWAKGYFVSTVGLTRRSSKHTYECKKRKIQDKRSLNFESTTPVWAWVSIISN